MTDFNAAFSHVVGLEGGYVNDPQDPGGETKYGISKRAHPTVDIKNLTLAQAKEIYCWSYWMPAQCDKLPYPLNAYVFDAAVNQGVGAAIRMLQTAAKVKVDGVIGAVTLNAIKQDSDIAHKFMAERALRYFDTSNFERFGKGWLKRIFKLAREA
jgi:lysozyme family protein